MERESFEDEEIGRILSDNFVCIKVDREERPDVDKVYMTFVQVCVYILHFLMRIISSVLSREPLVAHIYRQQVEVEDGP